MTGRRITAGGRNSSYRQDNRTGGGRNAARYAKASAYYNYGSAAQKVQPQRLPDVRRRRSEEELNRARMAARYNREKSRRMNPALVVFMVMIFSVMSVFLVKYCSLQYQLTSVTQEVAGLEKELSNIRVRNDQTLNDINGRISLDDIKYRAITELGMTYADEGQVISYENEIGDYVRQVSKVDK